MAELRTPLSRVKGLGSAKSGTSHFWHQRLTALILIPLVLWVGFSLAALPLEHASLISWIQQPLVTIGLVVLIVAIFYHAQMGLQVVIEDYIARHSQRIMVLLISNFVCLIFGVVGVVAVLKIAFGG